MLNPFPPEIKTCPAADNQAITQTGTAEQL